MTEIPTVPPAPPPERHPGPSPEFELPSLLVELADERDRLLRRQAVLISVIAHMVLIASLPFLVKAWPNSLPLMAPSARDLNDRNLTFLEMPPDSQRVAKRPNTNIVSDKDRIATSRQPTIDRKTLEELRASTPPGPPGAPGQPSAAPAPAQAAAPPAHGPAPASPGFQQVPAQQEAQLHTPAGKGVFSSGSAPGSAIEEATRAAAASRGGGGVSGEFGLGAGGGGSSVASTMDILSDTMGVDFGPYLQRVLQAVRTNWYAVIPESAYPPLRKKGRVTLQFAILRDGSVAGLHYESGSGDVSLDRAAYAGIMGSNPFPVLPAEFKGQFLALRIRFYYNPDRSDLR